MGIQDKPARLRLRHGSETILKKDLRIMECKGCLEEMSFSTLDKTTKKGFTLIIVLVMSLLIGLSATMLYSSASLDTMIAGNIRRNTTA